MKEHIQSLISTLKHDPTNEEAINGLEELVTQDNIEDQIPTIYQEIGLGCRQLVEAGRFEAACAVMDIQIVLADSPEQEAELLLSQAKIYDEELFNQRTALEKYKRVLTLTKDNTEIETKVEQIVSERANWEEHVKRFIEHAEGADDNTLKSHLLFSAAEKTYKNHKRGKDIPALLTKALEYDPSHTQAARLLETVLKEKERWTELAALYMNLADHRRVKEDRIQMLMAAGYTHGHRLEDLDAAAICYAEVLDLNPGNTTALKFLSKYYEDQEDWEHLAALYEDALRSNLSLEDETAMLFQAGMIHWRMRDKMDDAEVYFRRLRKLSPAHHGMLKFYRTALEGQEDKAQLLQILQDACRVTDDDTLEEELTKEIARLATETGGNTEKAIDAWKNILRHEPENEQARAELKNLYRKSEKWNNLLDTLKAEAESLPDDDIPGKIAVYKEIVDVYKTNLSLELMVIKTWDQVLQLDPDNQEALEELTETYQSSGRWNDLISILNTRSAKSEDPDEKIALLNRIAALWVERFNNFNRAVDPLEEILSLDPTNKEAIETLKGVYQKRRAWKPLLELFEKERTILEGDALKECLIEMAGLAGDRLSDYEKAISLWWQIYEIAPETENVLTTLEKLTERRKDWEGLAKVTLLRVETSDDNDEKAALLTKLGSVCKDRIKDPARAADAWSQLLEVQPGNAKAMRSLKNAYQEAQDWQALEELYVRSENYESLVEVLGIAADKTSDRETKMLLSFRCAELYDDPIGQPDRAVRHYERVLSVDPENQRAANALVPIYRRAEKWNRLHGVLEIVLNKTEDLEERVLRMDELRELCATRLNKRSAAFDWAAKAFKEMPTDKSVQESLESSAEEAGNYDKLVTLYKEHLDAFEGDAHIALEKHIAKISLEKLGDVADAITGYNALLEARPDDTDALDALDNIYRTNARWDDLISVYDRRLALTDDDAVRRDLKMEVARLYDEGIDSPKDAIASYYDVLKIAPDDVDALISLERILSSEEQWTELSQVLEKRRSLADPGTEQWRKLSFQLAALFDQNIGNAENAIEVYKQLIEDKPGDNATIEAMEHFLRNEDQQVKVAQILIPELKNNQDWRRLSWALAILIENSDTKEDRLELNVELSEVYGEKLKDLQLAFETLCVALKENPANEDLWDSMTILSEDSNNAAALAEQFAIAYQSDELDDDQRLQLAVRLAVIYQDKLVFPEKAEPYHVYILNAEPSAFEAYNALEEFYTSTEKWVELLALYRQVLAYDTFADRQLDVLLKICFIVNEVKRDVPAAIEAYQKVIEIDPLHTEGIRSLTELYEEACRWEELSDLLIAQLDNVSGSEAIELRYRLGEIAEQYLNKASDALGFYEQCIVEDTDHLKAQKALERLLNHKELRLKAAEILAQNYEIQGAAEPLARVLMITLEDDDKSDDDVIDTLTKVADLKERRLSDPTGAFDALSMAFEVNPGNEFVSGELARMADENNMSTEYSILLDKIIPTITDDSDLTAKLMGEVANLYAEKIGDLDKAEKAYRRLLAHDSENPEVALPAVDALDKLLMGSESYPELLEILRVKSKLLSDAMSQKEVLHRMAELEESILVREENAIVLFNEILELDDMDIAALSGLERLYERSSSWLNLIDVLRRRSLIESSEDIRQNILMRVARLFEEQVGNKEEAIAAYILVNDDIGVNDEALAALARLYAEGARYTDLLDIFEVQESRIQNEQERAEKLFAMGDLLRVHLDSPEQAVDRLESVLSIDAQHQGARDSLEALLDSSVKLRVIEILEPIFELEGDHERLLKYAEIKTIELEDPLERSAVLKKASEVAELGLDDLERAFDFIGRAFRFGAESTELTDIINNLERLAAATNEFEKLVSLYKEVAPDIMDGELQVQCFLRAADLAFHTLKDTDVAREYYVKILDMDGENEKAMASLEQIYEAQEEYLELFEIYRKQVQTVFEEDKRRAILFKQARVCEEHLDDISGAAQTYEIILESDPENPDAMVALERLYPLTERWADLMSLLDKRAEISDVGRVDLLYKLGDLAHDKLGDEQRALDYYQKVLELDARHENTMAALELALEDEAQRGRVAQILEPVYKQQGDWVKLASTLDAQLEFCDEPAERKELMRAIGTVYEEQLGNLDKAFETFAKLFKEDVEDKSSWELLNRLAGVLENYERLSEVFADALEDVVGDTPETAELAFMLGELYEHRLNKPKLAKDAYQRVLSYSPEDENAFLAVERMLLAIEAWSDLLDLYREAGDAAYDTDKQKEYLFKIAAIQEDSEKDLDAAIDAYRDILDLDDRDEKSILALDRLYFQSERFDDLTTHLQLQIDQADETSVRNELRRRLAEIQKDHLDDLTSAVDTYEACLEEDGSDILALSELERLVVIESQKERIIELLEPIYREADEWRKLIAILQAQVEFLDNPSDKVDKYREIAQLLEDRGSELLTAFEFLTYGFKADPQNQETLDNLVRLAEQTDNWEALTNTIGSVLEEIYDLTFKAQVLHLLGSTYDQQLDTPRKAITCYKAIIEIDEMDMGALDALDGLYNLVGDWDGLVEVLTMKANFASDPMDRAELLRTKASIHEDLINSPEDAIESHVQALEADSTSLVSIDALERLYEAKESWIELIEVKQKRLEIQNETDKRKEVLRSIGTIYEEKLNDSFEAINAWRSALEEDTQDPQAIVALDRLYTKEGMHTDLLDNLMLQKQTVQDQAMWVEIGTRIGKLQEGELEDLEGAIESYKDVLSQQPTHDAAIDALTNIAKDEAVRMLAIEVLEPLHRDAQRNEELVSIIELKLEVIDDPAEKLEEIMGLAQLYETGISDPGKALETYARALAEAPAREDILDNLDRIAAGEKLWTALAAIYEKQADNVYDGQAERVLLSKLGAIKEEYLHDTKGAIEAYRRILDSGTADKEVLYALDRLYEREGMWTELDEVLAQEITANDDIEIINGFRLRQGTIREREFEDIPGAIDVYRDIVESVPENREAVSALEALLEKDDFIQDVVEVLTRVYENLNEQQRISDLFAARLRVTEDEVDRVHLLCDFAVHQQEVICDLGGAFDAYAKAFALAPEDERVLQEMERLAGELGSWVALVDVTEKVIKEKELDPVFEIELGLKIAVWAATKIGDPMKAEERYRAILAKEAEHQEALDSLIGLLEGLGRFGDLLPLLKQKANVSYDYEAKKQILFKSASIAQNELSDIPTTVDLYREVLELDEADLNALDALVTITESAENYPDLADLLLRRAQYTADPIEGNGYRHRAATIFIGPLDNSAKAIEVFKEILESDTTDESAIMQLESLFTKFENWTELQDLLLQKMDNSQNPEARISVLRQLATLSEVQFEEPTDAANYLQDILVELPGDEPATEALERIYAKEERWQDLVELLETTSDIAREQGNSEKEMTLLVRIGEISDQQMSDPQRATEIYERVLERDSEHTRALSALARLYETGGDWDKVAEMLRKAAAAGRGGADEAEVHYRLAKLHENQLDDVDGAILELQKAIELHPGHLEANRALGEHYKEKGDISGLLGTLQREEEQLTEASEKIVKLLEIAKLQTDPIGDTAGAVVSLEKARDLDVDNIDVLLKLSDAYIGAGREGDAIPVIEKLIDAETNGGKKRSKKAATYHKQLAKAFQSRGDQDKALEHLQGAYKMDISNTEVLINLGKLHYLREEFDQALKLFRALLLQRFTETDGVTKADIYCYVGEIQLKQGDARKAKGMFQRGLDEKNDHEGCKAGLAQC